MQVLSERAVAETEDERLAVRKAVLDLGRDNVSGIKLTIQSRSDRPLAVKVEEVLPDQLSESDVQVHPGYNPEKWTITKTAPRMVFADELPPSGEVETIYGVRMDLDDLELLTGEPVIAESRELAPDEADRQQGDLAEAVTEPDSPAAAAGGDDSPERDPDERGTAPDSPQQPLDQPGGETDANAPAGEADPFASVDLRQSSGGDGAEVADEPTLDGGGDSSTDTSPEESDEADDGPWSADESFVYGETRSEEDASEGESASSESGSNVADSGPTGGTPTRDDPIQAFVEAIARGGMTDEQRDTIRDALDLEPDRRQETKLESLQSTVAKHSAFADEFEDLVDAVGSPAEAITDLRATLEGLDGNRDDVLDRLDDLETEVREGAETRQDLRERLDGLADDVRAGAEERDELRDRLAEATRETRVEAIERGKLRDRLDTLDDRMDALEAAPTADDDAIGDLRDRIDDLDDEVRAAADHRTELRERVDEYSEATREMVDAWDDLRDFSDELWSVSQAVAETQELLGSRFDELNRGFERLQETQATSIERLEARVSELEEAFETDEAGALREVIAAERRWRQQHEGGRPSPSRSGDP